MWMSQEDASTVFKMICNIYRFSEEYITLEEYKSLHRAICKMVKNKKSEFIQKGYDQSQNISREWIRRRVQTQEDNKYKYPSWLGTQGKRYMK